MIFLKTYLKTNGSPLNHICKVALKSKNYEIDFWPFSFFQFLKMKIQKMTYVLFRELDCFLITFLLKMFSKWPSEHIFTKYFQFFFLIMETGNGANKQILGDFGAFLVGPLCCILTNTKRYNKVESWDTWEIEYVITLHSISSFFLIISFHFIIYITQSI